jgi:hypothetical protein
MEAVCSYETVVNFCQTVRHHIVALFIVTPMRTSDPALIYVLLSLLERDRVSDPYKAKILVKLKQQTDAPSN